MKTLAALIVMTCPATAFAQDCAKAVTYSAPAYVAPAAVSYAPVYYNVPVYVPVYQAVYTPQPADGQRHDPDALYEIVAELRAMREQMAAGGPHPPQAAPVSISPAELFRSCVACHAADADAKGGGLTLFDDAGKLRPLSPPERRSIAKVITEGTMPPKGSGHSLTAAQRQGILGFVNVKAPK